VGAQLKGSDPLWSLEDSLQELALLAGTAGAQVVGSLAQRVEHFTPTYLGKGKLEELREALARTQAEAALFDDELTPLQQRRLEDALKIKVLDRTALILDVFASHARSREGRLQVELAQHQYLLPRLVGQWSHLERLGGGIGTRGPGETQLETDRRLINRRVQKLLTELESVRRRRAQDRARRRRYGLPTVALVGYTNAGKSTLLNALTQAGVIVEDKLFSTLDPVTRRLRLPGGTSVLLADTVGFIQKLPATLVAAFRATLEEVQEADLLLHVVDCTHPKTAAQIQLVDEVLEELGLGARPRTLVLNKVDLLASEEDEASQMSSLGLEAGEWPAVAVSATRGWGLSRLLQTIEQMLADVARAEEPRAVAVGRRDGA